MAHLGARLITAQSRFVCSSESVSKVTLFKDGAGIPRWGFVTASTALETNPLQRMDVPNYTVPPAGRELQVCGFPFLCVKTENCVSAAESVFSHISSPSSLAFSVSFTFILFSYFTSFSSALVLFSIFYLFLHTTRYNQLHFCLTQTRLCRLLLTCTF